MSINEETIERYVRFPETLDEVARRGVEELLATSRPARAIFDFYRSFYEELDRLEADGEAVLDFSRLSSSPLPAHGAVKPQPSPSR